MVVLWMVSGRVRCCFPSHVPTLMDHLTVNIPDGDVVRESVLTRSAISTSEACS